VSTVNHQLRTIPHTVPAVDEMSTFLGMAQPKRHNGNNLDSADLVGWVEPTGRKAISDGGFHPPCQKAVPLE
jgi:hypothetical protein